MFKNTNRTFYEPYIEFINENFDSTDHYFMIEEYNNQLLNEYYENNLEYINKFQFIKIIKELYISDKIILHSLTSPRLILLLFFQPWLLEKCYWAIWGADLYYYNHRKKNFKSNIYEFFRKYIIKNIGGLITHIYGDYELAKQWYGANGEYYYSFMYPSNLCKEYDAPRIKSNDKFYIQIGNSADPLNNHREIIMKLSKYKHKNIEIICPLSYGNDAYKAEIVKLGKDIFENKFIPLTNFMPFDRYLDILSKIDVAIFNHKRQQALGNITTLLGLGKKVYIREDITTCQFCLDHHLKVFSLNENFDDLFEKMNTREIQMNIENVKRQFSEEKLIDDWKKIFKDDIK
ncbi:TDP-N-acetylfucosamine:lipid II N-acetylfucosaminyltransferase [Alkalibaculum bacchi]|uniref:TDP-N-acetylfucosamine:lipid II N-acetylfucosaminyltransferase n=1 Tax=Alkalibaculum bacchi TaxID=645887 RepID=UPI0011DF3F97|nr:TDP-N-acetylfucosamine:lipid II N-acetylfucosaminyltransferase [Alkalibaculum bacchi]